MDHSCTCSTPCLSSFNEAGVNALALAGKMQCDDADFFTPGNAVQASPFGT